MQVESILPVAEIETRLKKLNPDGVPTYNRAWQLKNKDKIAKTQKSWREQHPYKIRNIKLRLSSVVGGAIRRSIYTGKNGRHWELLVGYTLKDLMAHLKRQFRDGMAWNNYGEWHIDHVVPVCAFNFSSTDDIDFKRCWALSNLQPLWATDNISKGARISKPFQPALKMIEEKDGNN